MNENKTNINWFPGHMQKTKRQENLQEQKSQKFDNEMNVFKLIAFEKIRLDSKMLDNYIFNTIDDFETISKSISRVKLNISKKFKI